MKLGADRGHAPMASQVKRTGANMAGALSSGLRSCQAGRPSNMMCVMARNQQPCAAVTTRAVSGRPPPIKPAGYDWAALPLKTTGGSSSISSSSSDDGGSSNEWLGPQLKTASQQSQCTAGSQAFYLTPARIQAPAAAALPSGAQRSSCRCAPRAFCQSK